MRKREREEDRERMCADVKKEHLTRERVDKEKIVIMLRRGSKES